MKQKKQNATVQAKARNRAEREAAARRAVNLGARDMARMKEQAARPFAEDASEAAREALANVPGDSPARIWREAVNNMARPGDVANLILQRDGMLAEVAPLRALADDEHARKIGEMLARLLHLEPMPDRLRTWNPDEARFQTAWGTKTAIGLARSVARVIQEGGNT